MSMRIHCGLDAIPMPPCAVCPVPVHSQLLDWHSTRFSQLLHLRMEANASLESMHLYHWCTLWCTSHVTQEPTMHVTHHWCAACHTYTMRDRQDEGRRGKRGIWRDLGGTKDGVRDTCALLSRAVLMLVPRLGFAESDSAHNPPHHTARQPSPPNRHYRK